MKKFYVSILTALLAAGVCSALQVSQPVRLITDGPAHNPTLSPDGKSLLYSSDNHKGLKLMTIATGQTVTLDESEGAGYAPVFNIDGSKVIYQTAKHIDGMLNRNIRSYDISKGTSEELAPMSRKDIDLAAVESARDYVKGGITNITVSVNGQTKAIDPVAHAHSYLWASLSPDGSRILFNEPFQGVFVCNTDGSGLVRVAPRGDFPAWAGDNLITFTESHDDGYVILDSTLKIHDLTTGITLDLTPADVKVGESSSAPDGTIVYSTLGGDVFLVNVK